MKQEKKRGLFATTLLAGLAIGAPAFAQTNTVAPAATEDEDVVIVTGTRIQTPGLTSSSPITTIGAEEIRLQATPEAEKFLRNLPGIVPADGSNVNNGTAGVSSLNLRGLGAQRNLILIDGKRVTPYNINGIVDLSTIPVSLIERVDVVTGGASAVYGSDAISGAANFILKKDFEGAEFNVLESQTSEGDGKIGSYSATVGANSPDGRGNAVLNINYSRRDGVKFGERDYGKFAVNTANGSGLGVTPASPAANCAAGNTVADPTTGSGTSIPATIDFGFNGFNDLQFRNDGSLGALCNSFNFNPFNYYQTPQERYGGIASGTYEISRFAEVYAKALFSSTNVTQQVAPSGVFFNKFTLPLANPFLTTATRNSIIAQYNAQIPGMTLAQLGVQDVNSNGVVDAGDTVTTYIARRTTELGARSTEYNNDFFEYNVGVRGDLGIAEGWTYDASLQYGQSNRLQTNRGYSNVTNIQKALLTDNVNNCSIGGGAITAQCVPLNLFGPEGSITPAMAQYASAVALQQQKFTQIIASASVAGPIDFLQSPLASSPLSLALGAEYREESGAFTPDECLKTPPTSCLGGAGGTTLPVSGNIFVNEVFGEAIVPLVSDKPLFQDLSLELGYRYADYEPVGINQTYKAGVNWTLVDGFRVRVMKQRATRAPNIGELFAPISTGLSTSIADPCSVANTTTQSATLTTRCISTGMTMAQVYTAPNISSGQVNVFTGTDPNALPDAEKADTLTVGFVWTPSFLGDAIKHPVLSVDYYDIDIDGVIGTFNANEIINGCYTSGITAFCQRIHRLGGSLKPAGAGIDLYTTNLKNAHAEGVELTAGFGIDLDTLGFDPAFGSLDFNFSGNYYMTNDSQSSSVTPITDCLGYYGTTCGNPTHEYRWTQRTTWTVGDFELSALWRHLGEVSVEEVQKPKTFDKFEHIDSYDYIDVAGVWNFNDVTRLSVTVTNLNDKDPPIIGNTTSTTASGGGNTLPSAYDSIGRVVTAGINFRF